MVDKLDPKVEQILHECIQDTSKHAKFFFPDTFHSPVNSMHKQILDLINSGEKKIVIAAPRGVGKTTWMNIGLATQRIMYRRSKFLLYISKSADNAMAQTENLKRELTSNRRIRRLFGSIKTRGSAADLEGFADEYDESFSKKVWTAFDTLVLPRGRGQQVRGLLYKSTRPDYILIDDLEDADMMMSDVYRDKLKEWFFADVEKCVSKYDKNFQFIYIDTLKHEDSLLQMLLDSSDWTGLRLEACDGDLNPTAPEYMNREELQLEYDLHAEKGMLDVFAREYRNLPISTSDPVFDQKDFQHVRNDGDKWTIIERSTLVKGQWIPVVGASPILKEDLYMVVIVDPAKTVKLHSADSACIAIGVHRKDRRILVCEVRAGKYYPDQLYDHMFEMVRHHNAHILAVEVTSLHEFISQPIENEMRVRGVFAQYVELQAKGKKEERVSHLAPFYRQKYMYHAVGHHTKLEGQLMSYPRPKLWDVMDAEAYIVKLMDTLDMYFDPIDDYTDNPEGEFDELDNESPRVYKRLI